MNILYIDKTNILEFILLIMMIAMLFGSCIAILFQSAKNAVLRTIGCAIFGGLFVVISCTFFNDLKHPTYWVTLNEDYSYTELIERYEVKEQKGLIYKVKPNKETDILDDVINYEDYFGDELLFGGDLLL